MGKELETFGESEQWYYRLLEDLKRLEFTGIIVTKHAIGKRILKEMEKFGKSKYGSKRIENISKDLKVGTTDIYDCINFAKKFPEISDGVGKLSWRQITHQLLPERSSLKRQMPKVALPKGKYSIIRSEEH